MNQNRHYDGLTLEFTLFDQFIYAMSSLGVQFGDSESITSLSAFEQQASGDSEYDD